MVLFLGTFSPPITGQSATFEAAYIHYPGEKARINKTPGGSGLFSKLFRHLRVCIEIFFFFLFRPIDVVYATTFSSVSGSISDFFLLTLNLVFKKKIYLHLHGANFIKSIESAPFFYRYLLINLLKRIEGAIVLTNGMKEQFEGILASHKIHVISNYFDPILDSIEHDLKLNSLSLASSKLRFGYFSNLIFSKGIIYLIDAAEKVKRKGYDLDLFIAGKFISDDYMDSKALEALFYDKILDRNYINFYGVLEGFEKLKFYQNIDVLSLPTFYKSEAQPLCIIEGFRSGCAIITTNFNYLGELVKDENGIKVSPQSVDELADAIIFYIENREALYKTQIDNIALSKESFRKSSFLSSVFNIIAGPS